MISAYVSACNRPSLYADALLAVGNSLTLVHGDRSPRAEVDAITVVQGQLVADADLGTVDQRAVGRARVEHGQVAIRHRDQHRMQPAMPGSAGGPVRSISGARPRDTLRRPIASRSPRAGNGVRRSRRGMWRLSPLVRSPPEPGRSAPAVRSTTAVRWPADRETEDIDGGAGARRRAGPPPMAGPTGGRDGRGCGSRRDSGCVRSGGGRLEGRRRGWLRRAIAARARAGLAGAVTRRSRERAGSGCSRGGRSAERRPRWWG